MRVVKHKVMRLLFVALLFTLSSCERRPLEELFVQTAMIPVEIDWSLTGLDTEDDPDGNLYRASVWLYSKSGAVFNGSSYREYKLISATRDSIEVPVGRYQVLIFNNSVGEFSSNVGFRGADKWETFEYYVKPDLRDRQNKSDNPILLEPDILAAWSVAEFEVTADMVTVSRSLFFDISPERKELARQGLRQLIGVLPLRLTHIAHVTATVKELTGAERAYATVEGMASSVFLASGEVSNTPSLFAFELVKRTYAPDNRDGVVESEEFNTLGPLASAQAQYGLSIYFRLVDAYDGSTTYPTPPALPFWFDVTQQVINSAGSAESVAAYYLKLRIAIDLSLPRLNVPGGFIPDIEDWEPEEDIEIPAN